MRPSVAVCFIGVLLLFLLLYPSQKPKDHSLSSVSCLFNIGLSVVGCRLFHSPIEQAWYHGDKGHTEGSLNSCVGNIMSCHVVYSMCVAYVPQVTDFEKRYFGSTRNAVDNVGQNILRANAHNSCSASNADGLNFAALSCRCRQIYVRLDLKLT
jgi:hypothetical protein